MSIRPLNSALVQQYVDQGLWENKTLFEVFRAHADSTPDASAVAAQHEKSSYAYLSIAGGSKDLIIRGGQNISPLELEQLIARHPSVSEVSVIGIPDPVYGERTCACVVLRSGSSLDLSDLVAFMTTQEIAPYKLPERLEVFDDFPKTAGGKLSKVTVKSAVAERAAAGV